MAGKWYDDLTLVKGLGEALSNAEVFEDSADFARFLSKPQKFNDYYDLWEAAGFPTSDDDDGWVEFVDSVSDDSEDSDDDDGEA